MTHVSIGARMTASLPGAEDTELGLGAKKVWSHRPRHLPKSTSSKDLRITETLHVISKESEIKIWTNSFHGQDINYCRYLMGVCLRITG